LIGFAQKKSQPISATTISDSEEMSDVKPKKSVKKTMVGNGKGQVSGEIHPKGGSNLIICVETPTG
jgi:hypothetical protein